MEQDDKAQSATVTESNTGAEVDSGTEAQVINEDQQADNDFAEAVSGEKPKEKPDTVIPDKPVDAVEKTDAEKLAAEKAELEKSAAEKADAEKLEQEKKNEPDKNADFDSGKYVNNFVETFPLKEFALPDGTKVNMKEISETYPDLFNGLTLMASHIANTLIDQAIAGGEIARGKDFNEIRDGIMKERFESGLNKNLPGATETIKSEAFEKWVSKQPKSISAMKDSNKVDDVLYVVKMFNNETKVADQKKKTVDLHKGDLRPGNTVKAKTNNDEVDLDEVWMEATK